MRRRCVTFNSSRARGSRHTVAQQQQQPQQLDWAVGSAPYRTDLDAIIILAGGILEGGGLPPWVHRRLDLAGSLWAQQHPQGRGTQSLAAASGDGGTNGSNGVPGNGDRNSHVDRDSLYNAAGSVRSVEDSSSSSRGCAILCSGGGTPHKPTVLSDTGYIIFESTSCASYLMDRKGVPADRILKETSSFDTVGNGYFSLVGHAIPSGWRRIGVVTSEFHMPRSRAIFETAFKLAAEDIWRDPSWYTLEFYSASDDGLFDASVYEARLEKEHAAVKQWAKDTGHMRKLSELHSWLFGTHMCYAVPRQHEFGRPTGLDKRLLASY